MFKDLKPYPEYVDAGLPWLERYPSHWTKRRFKQVLDAVDFRSTTGREELLTVSSARGVVPRNSQAVTMFKAASYIGHKLASPGDLVINSLWAWGRGLGVSRHFGIVSTAYGVYRPKSPEVLDADFLHLYVRSEPYNWELHDRSRGIWVSRLQLTDDRFLTSPFLAPPADEQRAIVTYLAHAHQRINEAISAKKRMIGLLKEQKLTFVNEAMTRGVADSPALGDSGDIFLGMMPEHWQDLTVSRVIDFVTSGSRGWAEYYSDEGALFLQSGNLGRNLELNLARIQRVSPPSDSEGTRTQVQKGDVLVCITGALTGNVAVVDRDLGQDAYVNQHVALVRPKEAFVYPRFLGLTLWCATGQVQFKAAEYGGTKQGLGLTDVKGVRIGLPPLDEQRAIVTAVDRLSDQIDRQVSVVSREIALLEEFRTRLTADVMTGQVDVRSIAATLPPIDLADVFDASAGAVGAEDGETADEADVEDE